MLRTISRMISRAVAGWVVAVRSILNSITILPTHLFPCPRSNWRRAKIGRFMASKHRARKARPAASAWVPVPSNRAVYIGFAAAVLLFYCKPLFDSAASIQWDAVDVQFSPQKYFSD